MTELPPVRHHDQLPVATAVSEFASKYPAFPAKSPSVHKMDDQHDQEWIALPADNNGERTT